MKVRSFPIAPDLPTWRLAGGLVLAFLPFSLIGASVITAMFLFSGDADAGLILPVLAAMVSAGVIHELGHWLASQPGSRAIRLITTPGLSAIRLHLEPDLPPGSGRWLLRMVGGSLANTLVAATLLLWSSGVPQLRHEPWITFSVALHLLTAVVNLVPFKTGFTGATDGWLIWEGLRERWRRSASATKQTRAWETRTDVPPRPEPSPQEIRSRT